MHGHWKKKEGESSICVDMQTWEVHKVGEILYQRNES